MIPTLLLIDDEPSADERSWDVEAAFKQMLNPVIKVGLGEVLEKPEAWRYLSIYRSVVIVLGAEGGAQEERLGEFLRTVPAERVIWLLGEGDHVAPFEADVRAGRGVFFEVPEGPRVLQVLFYPNLAFTVGERRQSGMVGPVRSAEGGVAERERTFGGDGADAPGAGRGADDE